MIVLITHEINVIKLICDRMTVISGGKVVKSGEVFDVFTHPQHASTQQLVSYTFNPTLPERLRQHLPGQLLEILFIGGLTEQPMLSEVAVKFGVVMSTLYGRIEYIDERVLGILMVQLTAPHNLSAVDATMEHIR